MGRLLDEIGTVQRAEKGKLNIEYYFSKKRPKYSRREGWKTLLAVIIYIPVKVKHESTVDRVRFNCDECEFTGTTKSLVRKHKQIKHELIKYPCDQCEFIASRTTQLKDHKASKHEGFRYPCDICGYAATLKKYLLKHRMRKHQLSS